MPDAASRAMAKICSALDTESWSVGEGGATPRGRIGAEERGCCGDVLIAVASRLDTAAPGAPASPAALALGDWKVAVDSVWLPERAEAVLGLADPAPSVLPPDPQAAATDPKMLGVAPQIGGPGGLVEEWGGGPDADAVAAEARREDGSSPMTPLAHRAQAGREL